MQSAPWLSAVHSEPGRGVLLACGTQFLGGGKVGAAGQTARSMMSAPPGSCCSGPGQHRRGDRVDDGVKAGQQCGQGRQGRGAAPGTAGIGALLGAAGGHGDAPAFSTSRRATARPTRP